MTNRPTVDDDFSSSLTSFLPLFKIEWRIEEDYRKAIQLYENTVGVSCRQDTSNLPRTQTSLSRWKCARKGRREGDPSHGPLRFITSRSPLPCEKRSAWGGGWLRTKRGTKGQTSQVIDMQLCRLSISWYRIGCRKRTLTFRSFILEMATLDFTGFVRIPMFTMGRKVEFFSFIIRFYGII